jgi:nicotinate-nucleotide adenylyltransferase
LRIGVFGGTYNPPHVGHLIAAQEAWLQLGLDHVLLMPAWSPPHKPVPDDPGPRHRLELCREAVAGDAQRLRVSDLEVVREGTSFTVDTLEELKRKTPDSDLYLILGGDVAAGFPSWREPERILSLATLALAGRKGTPEAVVADALANVRGGERACFFQMPTVEISSTMIRKRAAAGQPIKYLVPEGVEAYIARHRLYQGEASV